MEYDYKSNLCKAVDNSPSWRGVKKHHWNPHYVIEQPCVQYTGGINRSIGQEQCAKEHEEPCGRKRDVLNKDKALKATRNYREVWLTSPLLRANCPIM